MNSLEAHVERAHVRVDEVGEQAEEDQEGESCYVEKPFTFKDVCRLCIENHEKDCRDGHSDTFSESKAFSSGARCVHEDRVFCVPQNCVDEQNAEHHDAHR